MMTGEFTMFSRLSMLCLLPVCFSFVMVAHADEELAPFQGVWKVVELTDSGVNIPQDEFQEMLHSGGNFRIEDDQIIFHSVLDGRQYSKTLQVDNKHAPPHFNVRMDDETTGWGIYRIDGDQLTVCMSSESATDRPEEFSSERDSSHVLMVLLKDNSQPQTKPDDDDIKITPRDRSKPLPPKSVVKASDRETKPIKEQVLIPADLKLALGMVGTWKIPQQVSPFYVWLKPDGTFVTSRDVPRIRTFSYIFFNAPVSSGRWTVNNGVLQLNIFNSVHTQRVGAGVEYAIQNLTPQNLVLTSHFGASVSAVRVR